MRNERCLIGYHSPIDIGLRSSGGFFETTGSQSGRHGVSPLSQWKFLLVLLCGLGLVAISAAQAADYYGASIAWGRIETINFQIDTHSYNQPVGELQISFTGTTKPAGYDNFTGFCIDVDGNIRVNTSFLASPTSISDAKSVYPWVDGGIERASYLYSTKRDSVTSGAEAAALQVALWEVLNNGTRNGVVQNRVSVSAGTSGTIQNQVYSLANQWVTEALGQNPNQLNYQNTIWQTRSNNTPPTVLQGLIGPTAVPEPTQVALAMAIALGVWSGISRFKKSCGKNPQA
jgi:hypothetical protein